MNIKEDVIKRFLDYVAVDTTSDPQGVTAPSTPGQATLAAMIAQELTDLGFADVILTDKAYVYAKLPATDATLPGVGFIAHLDTSPDCSGANIYPKRMDYAGGDICLNEQQQIWMRESDFPQLARLKGQQLIVTDGTTLLGADDKAGIAEIITALAALKAADDRGEGFAHGTIAMAFTPDEEIGSGAADFDFTQFGVPVAYTLDGDEIGKLEYENFNAASMEVVIHGRNVHPGSAKGKMKNALLIGMEFERLLPVFEKPEYTENYEGFYHLHGMSGDVEQAQLSYILRDHDAALLEKKKQTARLAAAFLNERFGADTVEVEIADSYRNMAGLMADHMELIEKASQALQNCGVTPFTAPIRGGTDGACLTAKGLPCPNLCTGGGNYHGRFEYVSVDGMEKMVCTIMELVRLFGSLGL